MWKETCGMTPCWAGWLWSTHQQVKTKERCRNTHIIRECENTCSWWTPAFCFWVRTSHDTCRINETLWLLANSNHWLCHELPCIFTGINSHIRPTSDTISHSYYLFTGTDEIGIISSGLHLFWMRQTAGTREKLKWWTFYSWPATRTVKIIQERQRLQEDVVKLMGSSKGHLYEIADETPQHMTRMSVAKTSLMSITKCKTITFIVYCSDRLPWNPTDVISLWQWGVDKHKWSAENFRKSIMQTSVSWASVAFPEAMRKTQSWC